MQTFLLNKLLAMSKFFMYVSFFQCLFATVVIADNTHAQSLEKVEISNKWKKVKLERAFADIQNQTAFFFSYDRKQIERIWISGNHQKTSLLNVLKYISANTGIQFSIKEDLILVKYGLKKSNQAEIIPETTISIPQVEELDVIKSNLSYKVIYQVSNQNAISEMVIRGNVFGENGESLVGATVLVKETGQGTVTDVDGTFSVVVPESESVTLVVSYVGYRTKEITVNGETQMNITLEEDVSRLDEVVVVGYGIQKKVNLTGSVAKIDNKNIENRPITQTSQALQGLTPGVFINTNSGEPGNDQADITIRGIGTLNNSNPLILVDGIEAPINSVNPNDIESINVLKDAASASIYGSRAANGVILITTKQGSFNQKTQIQYDGYYGVSNPTILPDMVWDNRQYMELYREAAQNSGRNFGFDDEDIARYDNIPSTDWMEAMTKDNVPITNHNLSFRGGTEKISYYFSTGYLYQEGFLAGKNDYNRYSSRLNLNAKLSEQLKFGTSLSYFNEDGNLTPKDQTGRSFANKGSLVFSGAMIQHPVVPVFDQFGRYGSIEAALGIERNRPSGQGVADNETVELGSNDFLGKAFLEFEPIKNLKFLGTVGLNFQDEVITDIKREYVTYDPVTGNPWTNGNGTRNRGSVLVSDNRQSLNITTWLQGSYNFKVNRHNFGVLAGFNREKANIERSWIREREFGTKDVISLGQGSLIETEGGISEWGLVSLFGRINYDFDGKYLLEFNLRRDASSRFGENNRWATFPAFSAGWVLSNESFWNTDIISFAKIRASWGKLGNQSSNLYPFASQVGLGENYNGNSGAALVRLGNPDLRWEETTTTDIGLDLRLFEDKLSLEADYFIKETNDILTDLENPLTSGISASTTVNAASMENKGWEFAANYKDKIGQVSFNLGFNITHVKNEVTAINPELSDSDDRIQLNRSDNVYIVRGEPIFSIFGHQLAGIFQTQEEIDAAPDHSFIGTPAPGDFRYTDLNGDGVINADDQTVIGNRQPEWLYGGNFSFSYKGLELSGLVQGIGKAEIWTARMYGPFPFAGVRQWWYDNRWTPENPSETVPRVWVDRRGYNGNSIETSAKQNSFWVQDRAYFRLKNLQLAYNLPKSVLAKLPFESLRVYVNGQNLWTQTDLVDLDPERFTRESHATNVLPQNKVISFGVNAIFK